MKPAAVMASRVNSRVSSPGRGWPVRRGPAQLLARVFAVAVTLPGEPELHAGGQRRTEVEVVVSGDGGGGLVDLREHGRHPLRGRRGRGRRGLGHSPAHA